MHIVNVSLCSLFLLDKKSEVSFFKHFKLNFVSIYAAYGTYRNANMKQCFQVVTISVFKSFEVITLNTVDNKIMRSAAALDC